MASKKPIREIVEYQVITATGRCAHTFSDYDRALAYFNVVQYPGWKLVESVTCLYDRTPAKAALEIA
jgi:hypothetical protein